MEVFRDIPTYEGLYKVTNFGRVLSLNYNHTKKRGFLSPNNINGYLNVTICKDGEKRIMGIHRLVIWAFKGFLSDKYNHVDHKNTIKSDNRLGNLQVLTSRENTLKDKKIESNTKLGVSKVRGKFRARISINGKSTHLRYFDTEQEAHEAYAKTIMAIAKRLKNE